MTTGRLFLIAWDWEPSVIIGCVVLAGLYWKLVRFRVTMQSILFSVGILLMFWALVGPLDALGDTYLFSAHMAQHLVLYLLVPPLLIAGLPRELAERILRRPLMAGAERILRRPVTAWLIGVLVLWIWHAPPLYNATLRSEGIHILEHLCFLVAGTIYWWPEFSPLEASRMPGLQAVLYIFLGGAALSILGVILFFAPVGMYPAYLHPADPLGALHLIRQDWGLTPKLDQELGALLMWVPGMLFYLFASFHALGRFYGEPETAEEFPDERAPRARASPDRKDRAGLPPSGGRHAHGLPRG